jgi:P4 family phage/plasmid primase-like protien
VADQDRKAAHEYLDWGWTPLPCAPRTKYPLIKWEPYQAVKTVSHGDVDGWFGTDRPKNIWLMCGPRSGLIVVDLDGFDTVRWFRQLCPELDFPTIPRVKTSKGWHLYFAWAAGTDQWHYDGQALGLNINLDVRNGERGGVLAPPSVHDKTDHVYTWEVRPPLGDGGRPQLPALPPQLYTRSAAGVTGAATANTSGHQPPVFTTPPGEGGRNTWLAGQAGHLAKKFRNDRASYDSLFDLLAQQVPGLDPEEVAKTRESIWGREARKADTESDPTVKLGSGDQHELTDMGNARRLIDNHSTAIRYVGDWNSWLVWDNRRWRRDNTNQTELMAKSTIRSILTEATTIEDDDRRKATVKHAFGSQSARAVRAMTGLAQSEREVAISATDLDANGDLLNLQNGTYEWRNGTFRTHNPDDLNTKLAGAAYDLGASCPNWDKALAAWLPDPEVRRFVQRAVGYSLTSDLSEKCLFVVYGPTDAGKSVFIETILALSGDYGHVVKDDTLLLARNKGGNTDDLADLQGIRFASLSETPEGARLDVALIKRITGGTAITAMRKYEHAVTFQPTSKFWIDTNHRPRINPDDDAIWGRVRMVPFEIRIPDEQQDKGLRGKVLLELPGILNWALAGLAEWRRDGLGQPPAVRKAVAEYREAEDPLEQFLEEMYEINPDGRVKSSSLHLAYQEWSGDRISAVTMVRRMAGKGYERKPYAGLQYYRGLKERQEPGKLPLIVQHQQPRQLRVTDGN